MLASHITGAQTKDLEALRVVEDVVVSQQARTFVN